MRSVPVWGRRQRDGAGKDPNLRLHNVDLSPSERNRIPGKFTEERLRGAQTPFEKWGVNPGLAANKNRWKSGACSRRFSGRPRLVHVGLTDDVSFLTTTERTRPFGRVRFAWGHRGPVPRRRRSQDNRGHSGRRNAQKLQVTTAFLLLLDGLEEGFEVSGAERARPLALDNLEEDRGAVL